VPLKAVLLIIALMPALASHVFADEAAAVPNVVGIDVSGLPDSLHIPHVVMPYTPVPYSNDVLMKAGRGLLRFLAENGYPYSQISVEIVRESSREVVLRYHIVPDDKVCFGPPLIFGVEPERAGIFLRDVRFSDGQPYSLSAIEETLRRLNSRPYVLRANAMEPVVIEDALGCGELAVTAAVPINITEKHGMEFEGALGYESERDGKGGRFTGRLGLSFVNMLRYGEEIEAFYSGTGTIQKLRLAGLAPWVAGLPLELGAAAGLEVEDGGYGYFNGEIWGAVEAGGRWRIGAAAKGSETVPPDSVENTYRFYGADIFISLLRRPWERGITVWEIEARTGSGAAHRDKPYARATAELSSGVHLPISADYALAGRISGATMFTNEERLPPAELFRTGGSGSLRGYSEEEFAFRAVVFAQAEALYYFNQIGSVFIFVDGGAGFDRTDMPKLSSAQKMLGYGAGLRFLSDLGLVSLEWARNVDDGWSLGRVHLGIRTSMR